MVIARQVRLAPEILLETLCFHAQQAVEKSIKAVLVHEEYQEAIAVAQQVLAWADSIIEAG